MVGYTRGCCNPPVEKVRPPFSLPKIGVLAGRKPARRQTFPRDTGRALEPSRDGKLSIGGRRLRIGTKAPLRLGLGGILRQRKAHRITNLVVAAQFFFEFQVFVVKIESVFVTSCMKSADGASISSFNGLVHGRRAGVV
jgi:hypothetical protein